MEQNQDVSMITCLPNPTTKNSNHSLMKTGPNVECDKPLKQNLIHGFGKNKLDGSLDTKRAKLSHNGALLTLTYRKDIRPTNDNLTLELEGNHYCVRKIIDN